MSTGYDPNWVSKTTRDCWNFLVSQLGHWNKLKVIAMDTSMYSRLPNPVLMALVEEATKMQSEEYVWAQDGCNEMVYVLGPKKLMYRDIVVIDDVVIWDPKHVHTAYTRQRGRAASDVKIPRPPNAFILYRKDKHPELKAAYPEIHNNEISVLVGSMWKNEANEVRQKYYLKSMTLRQQLMAANPDYKYRPRRSSDIPRRRGVETTRRRNIKVTNGQSNSNDIMRQQDEDVVRALFPGTSLIKSSAAGVQIYQPNVAGQSGEVHTITGWVPHAVPVEFAAQREQLLAQHPPIDPVAVFGQVVPTIDYDAALLPANDATDEFIEQMVNDD